MRPTSEASIESLLREVRRWKLAAVAMLAVIIGLGLISASLLRSLDDHYAGLIDRSVPVLNEVRALSTSALSAQRSLLASLLAEDEAKREAAYERIAGFVAAGRHIRDGLDARDIFENGKAALRALHQTGADYEAAVGEFLALARSGRVEAARELRLNKVKPALDAYLAQLEIAGRYVEARSQKMGDDYSAEARSHSAIIFGLAGAPLLIALGAVVTVAAIILWMIIIFRRAGVDDAA